jgi:hypothetical protein
MKRSGSAGGLIRAFAIGACLISISVYAAPAGGSTWTSPEASDTYDWALLLVNQNH